ncbi:MAG: Rdx family protein [Chloroflexaceae bacterium]|nr:Rdx family protein [Chloroflexaceae bacterium]
MAESLVNSFSPNMGGKHPIEELTLIPSGGGCFEVTIDGELVYSKNATGKHTTNEHVIELVRQRLTK